MGVQVSGGRCEDIGRALGGLWRVVRVGAGGLIYRQIKSLHCSGYLLVVSNKVRQGLPRLPLKLSLHSALIANNE